MTITEFYECQPRDVYIFLDAMYENKQDRIEQEWDYTRQVMWAIFQKDNTQELKPSRFIRLKRDGPMVAEITPYQQQELDRWSEECDEDMPLVDWDGNPIN